METTAQPTAAKLAVQSQAAIRRLTEEVIALAPDSPIGRALTGTMPRCSSCLCVEGHLATCILATR